MPAPARPAVVLFRCAALAVGAAMVAASAVAEPAPADVVATPAEPAPPATAAATGAAALGSSLRGDEALARLVERQKEILATDTEAPGFDEAEFRRRAQALADDYERYLRAQPDHVPAITAYALYLSRLDHRRQAASMLLRANQLDGKNPLVKNQLGNYLAEEGRPTEALGYFLSAAELAPLEPLYHYQVGLLIAEARDDFLKSGDWTRDTLDRTMLKAFTRAAELAPTQLAYAYRAAEAHYDTSTPDWTAALAAWRALEPRATTPVEQQTLQLQQALCLIRLGRIDEARPRLAAVTEPVLQRQKEKLVELLAAPPPQ